MTSFNHTISPSVFPSGQINNYKLRAQNGVGLGAFSTVTSVTCLLVPVRLNTPVMRSVTYNSISFGWASISSTADTGGDPINNYLVYWYERPCYLSDYLDCSLEVPDLGTWVNLSNITTSPYRYTHSATHFHPGTDFHYRVCGQNGVGLGACSANLTITTDDAPLAMVGLTNTSLTYNTITL